MRSLSVCLYPSVYLFFVFICLFSSVCVPVFIRLCIYLSLSVCVCLYTSVYLFLSLSVGLYSSVCLSLSVCVSVFIRLCVWLSIILPPFCLFVSIQPFVNPCIHPSIDTHINTYTEINSTYMHTSNMQTNVHDANIQWLDKASAHSFQR